MKGWQYNELIGEAHALVSDGELRFLGYVDDTQMPRSLRWGGSVLLPV